MQSKHKVIQLWDWKRTLQVLPFLRQLTKSLRENWLRSQSLQVDIDRFLKKIEDREGNKIKMSRNEAVQKKELEEEREKAGEAFQDNLKELIEIDLYPVDAVKGIVFIPFSANQELAWYIFDLFEESGNVVGWRYHRDSTETCRPLAELKS